MCSIELFQFLNQAIPLFMVYKDIRVTSLYLLKLASVVC